MTCDNCGAIFIDTHALDRIDAGGSIIEYDQGYWRMELAAARERSREAALARLAEVFYYARRPKPDAARPS